MFSNAKKCFLDVVTKLYFLAARFFLAQERFGLVKKILVSEIIPVG